MKKSNKMKHTHAVPTRSQATLRNGSDPVQRPLVSVIVPTFNRPDTLKTALESVLEQAYQNFEIIVVNDGGKDVKGVIDALNRQNKIVYLRHNVNKGLPAARNTGLRKAKGKYIAYLDDDDKYYPNHLDLLVAKLESRQGKVAYADSRHVYQMWVTDRYVALKSEVLYSRDFERETLFAANYIPVINLMHRRDLLDVAGYFDEGLDAHEDWDLWIRFAQHADFYHVKEVTAEVNMRTDGTSMTGGNREPFLRTMKLIHDRYARLVTDDTILEQQKTFEEFLSVDVAIGQIPSEELSRIVRRYIQKKDLRIDSAEAALKDKDIRIGALDAAVKEKDSHIGNLDMALRDKASRMEYLDAAVKEKDARIDNLEIVAREKDSRIDNLEIAAREKDSRIDNLEIAAREKNARIDNLEMAVKEKNASIDNLEMAVREKIAHIENLDAYAKNIDATLHDIYKSHGWKLLLAYYRMIERMFPRGTARRRRCELVLKGCKTFAYEGVGCTLTKSWKYLSGSLARRSGQLRQSCGRIIEKAFIRIPALFVMCLFSRPVKLVARPFARIIKYLFPSIHYLIFFKFKNEILSKYIIRLNASNSTNNLNTSAWKKRFHHRHQPLVSVIVPNYNHSAHLKERLESIYQQTYSNIEVILLDDCSRDDSRIILKEYADKYPGKTKLFFNERNSGSAFAQWQKGISLAGGELVWIAESDDYCDINFLEMLVEYFADEAVMLAYCRTVFTKDGKPIWTIEEYLADIDAKKWTGSFLSSAHHEVNASFALKNIIPNVSSAVFRNPFDMQLFSDLAWRRMKICGDWIFYLHIIHGGVIAYSCETTNYYRQHDKNISVVLQKNDVYYQEHQVVAEHVASLYNVPESVFDRQEAMLRSFWRINRDDYSDKRFMQCYDIQRIKSKSGTRKPNVLMLGYAFSAGGGETVPIILSNGLKKMGYGITFIDCNMQQREPGVRNTLHPSIPVVDLNGEYCLAEIVNQLGGEILHSHHASVDVAISELKIHFPSCRHIVTLHGMYETMNDDDLIYVLPKLMANVDRWLFTAEKNLATFKRHGYHIEDKLFRITNALEVADVRPLNRHLLNIPDDAFVLCMVSRAIPEKGWDEAIQTVKRARELSGRDIRLILIGDGPEYDRLRTLSDEDLQFLGFRPNIRDYFAMSDLGYLPSRFDGESFPLVLIDSLLAGRPVLASDIGEIKNMLTNETGKMAGAVFQLRNGNIPIEEAAGLIVKFATDETYYQDRFVEVIRTAEKFQLSSVLDDLDKHYRALVNAQ